MAQKQKNRPGHQDGYVLVETLSFKTRHPVLHIERFPAQGTVASPARLPDTLSGVTPNAKITLAKSTVEVNMICTSIGGHRHSRDMIYFSIEERRKWQTEIVKNFVA